MFCLLGLWHDRLSQLCVASGLGEVMSWHQPSLYVTLRVNLALVCLSPIHANLVHNGKSFKLLISKPKYGVCHG